MKKLFERIRAKCRQQRWHGPDINNPFQIVEQMRLQRQKAREDLERRRRENPNQKGWFSYSGGFGTVYFRDHSGNQYAINLDTDLESMPFQTDFEYPPATEEELTNTENYLRYPLPPLLRALYANVANGGFGPGYGLDGVRGYMSAAHVMEGTIWQRNKRNVDLCIYLRKYDSQDYFEFPWYVWPDSLFTLCHWGCGYFSHLDCVSGRIFYGGAGKNGYGLRLQAHSLYEWLDLWLKGVNLEHAAYSIGGHTNE